MFRYALEESVGAKFLQHTLKSIFRVVEEFPAAEKDLKFLQSKFEVLRVSYSYVSGWFWIIDSLKANGNFASKMLLHFAKLYPKSLTLCLKLSYNVYFAKMRLWCPHLLSFESTYWMCLKMSFSIAGPGSSCKNLRISKFVLAQSPLKKCIYQNVIVLLMHTAKYGRLSISSIWNGFHTSV